MKKIHALRKLNLEVHFTGQGFAVVNKQRNNAQ
jgi:hypothetical protein